MPEVSSSKIVDVSKAIGNKISNMSVFCAVLVLLIHIERSSECVSVNWVTGTISQIGVPFFFAISGFLLLNRYGIEGWYRTALRKRISSLLIPFLCLNICWFPFKYAIHYIGYAYFGADHSNYTMVFSFVNFLRAFSPIAVYGSPCIGPLWYVRALMWLVLFSPIVAYCVCRTKKACLLTLLGLLGLWVLQVYGVFGGMIASERASLDYSFRCLFYFAFGMSVRKWNWHEVKTILGFVAFVIGVGCLVVDHVSPQAVIGIIGVFLTIIGVWSIMPSCEIPSFLTKNCFVVYALHTVLIYLGHVVLKALGWLELFNSGVCVWVLAIFYLALCCVIGSCVRKYMPKLALIFFGGR